MKSRDGRAANTSSLGDILTRVTSIKKRKDSGLLGKSKRFDHDDGSKSRSV